MAVKVFEMGQETARRMQARGARKSPAFLRGLYMLGLVSKEIKNFLTQY